LRLNRPESSGSRPGIAARPSRTRYALAGSRWAAWLDRGGRYSATRASVAPGVRQATLLKGVARREFDMMAAWSVCRLGLSLPDLIGLLGELRFGSARFAGCRRTRPDGPRGPYCGLAATPQGTGTRKVGFRPCNIGSVSTPTGQDRHQLPRASRVLTALCCMVGRSGRAAVA